jgi:hypothetical protein
MKEIVNRLIENRELLSKSLIENKDSLKAAEVILKSIESLDGVLIEIFKYWNPES